MRGIEVGAFSCRGQKHQRREKQEQHLTEAEQLCNSTLDCVLDEPGPDTCAGHALQPAQTQSPSMYSTEPQCEQPVTEVDTSAGAEAAASGGAEAEAEGDCGILVSRGRAAGASGDEEVEFQGCGVPSAFADTAGFGGNAADDEDDDGSGGDGPGDRLGALPRRTLTLRPSGMRVSHHAFNMSCISLGACFILEVACTC